MKHQPTRRRALTVLAASLLAHSENSAAAAFHGIDVTGAPYGRRLELDDTKGRRRGLNEFKGKAVLLFFGFTQCPDICPTALGRAVEVRQRLGSAGAKLQVIFVTLDPERDTPKLLEAYMKAFHPSFLALSGNLDRTANAAAEFKIFYQKVPTGGGYTMDHSAISFAFDKTGRLRLALPHALTAEQVADDLRKLLVE